MKWRNKIIKVRKKAELDRFERATLSDIWEGVLIFRNQMGSTPTVRVKFAVPSSPQPPFLGFLAATFSGWLVASTFVSLSHPAL